MMRASLQKWINDADNARHLSLFSIAKRPVHLANILTREEDYFISLVGELFESLNSPDMVQSNWAQLGNAFLQFSAETSVDQLAQHGISKDDATLFSAAAFYFGDYSASACLTMRRAVPSIDDRSLRAACFDFLARPPQLRSQIAITIKELILSGNLEQLSRMIGELHSAERLALNEGPEPWIAAKLLNRLLENFNRTNLRAVLPHGNSDFWTPLVKMLVNRKPSTWEFFPSQIEAIRGGFLTSNESFSLQMPTGAGKTTLCETLLFWHLKSNPNDVAVMVVPYRSLASELRETLVRSLNSLNIAARCAYGGTVPTGNEIHDLASIRVVIATPEALIGLIGADPEFAKRIALVICDEGHLLDNEGRGIGLELLLARLRGRQERPIRFVFMSAIVPNIEEINAWLGGTNETVVRSTYRPAIAEFAVLRPVGTGANTVVELIMHPHEPDQRRFTIDAFLDRNDFTYLNAETQRNNTYNFDSTKSQAIAAARKALPMGATAIFAMNKAGDQGAVGIAESFIKQLEKDLPLPKPIAFASREMLQKNIAYLEDEYSSNWIGTQCLRNGIVLHHGDILQETREVLEALIRSKAIRLIICTSTLAEGVNLPIRTLVLYSVQRREMDGKIQNMLARDIKNLVGRAGRAGANTKGLVICAKPEQWKYVQPVAMLGAGEAVKGSLSDLINRMTNYLADNKIALNNDFLEGNTVIHPIIDGVDATLIELISSEIGEQEFIAMAVDLAAQTFAARQLPEAAAINLRSIFALRATRLVALRNEGKIAWARATGAKVRLIDSVERDLLPRKVDWQRDTDPLSAEIQKTIFQWAWMHSELREKVNDCFRLKDDVDVETVKSLFFEIAHLWMTGLQFKDIAALVNLPIDVLLAVHTTGITFALQTLVEQGISLLAKRLEADGIQLAEGISNFPEHLRFGSPTVAARMLAASGLRHRKACVRLGAALESIHFSGTQSEVKIAAGASLKQFASEWRTALGDLVYEKTLSDLSTT